MATFTPEEIEFIKARGNDYCRRVWLGLYEGESVNLNDEQSVRDFMSDKYEKKRYYLDAPANSILLNGVSSMKNKAKTKAGNNAAVASPLISISPQMLKGTTTNNTTVQTAKVVSNLLPAASIDVSHRLARPVSSLGHPLMNSANPPPVASAPINIPPPVPE